MELVVAIAIGVLVASGVWLLLRPRTFQVIIGLSLVSYAVNLFIFGMGRLRTGAPPILDAESGRRSHALRRSGSTGTRSHGNRHWLRDDSLVPGRPAGRPRARQNGPCRWSGA